MRKLTILGVLAMVLVLLVSASVHAGELKFKEVKAYVDGKKDSGVSETGGIADNIAPESKLKFQVTVENTFTEAEKIEIQGVSVEVTIDGIDDDDDLDDESDDFDLDALDDKKVTFSFDVPLEVDTGSYNVKLTAKGRAVNTTSGSSTFDVSANTSFKVEVEKDKHDIWVYRKVLTPSSVSCGRAAELDVGLINQGEEDEDDVYLEVSNEALGLKQKVGPFELTEGANDDDVKMSKKFKVTTVKELAPGVYPLTMHVTYDKDSKSKTEAVDLTVTACEEKKEEPKAEAKKEEPKKEVIEVKTDAQATAAAATQVVQQPTAPALTSAASVKTAPPVTLSSSAKKAPGFLESYGTGLVVLLYVVVVVVAIALFGMLFRRRD
ncbi:TPA: hypothetical protein HA246_03710 [Candidatus Woesearchaeota archaeon]|nr:hypothetical protein [Candidatus Woesearchaeota archaeon]